MSYIFVQNITDIFNDINLIKLLFDFYNDISFAISDFINTYSRDYKTTSSSSKNSECINFPQSYNIISNYEILRQNSSKKILNTSWRFEIYKLQKSSDKIFYSEGNNITIDGKNSQLKFYIECTENGSTAYLKEIIDESNISHEFYIDRYTNLRFIYEQKLIYIKI